MSKMILIDEATVKLALEALEYIDLTDNDRDFLHPHECYMIDEAITALREALAEQPASKPWVGLTPEEVQAAVYDENGCVVDYEDYASAIEVKLKEKNA